MPDYTKVLSKKYDGGTDAMIKIGGVWAEPGTERWIFKPNHGYYIEVPNDTTISWPAEGPATSGVSTFEVLEDAGATITFDDGSPAKQFQMYINLETLNPMEFYDGSNLTYADDKYAYSGSYPATVDRRLDIEDSANKLQSGIDTRYMKLRSIEIKVDKHVYLDRGKKDVVQTITTAPQTDRVSPPSDGSMYVYCARSGDATKIMVVNADNNILDSLATQQNRLRIPVTFYIASDKYNSMKIDYPESYIGTTSVFSRAYDPIHYEHTNLTTNPVLGRYDIHNWVFKLKTDVEDDNNTHVDDGSQGSYLRFSIDDGTTIYPGGVSTTTEATRARKFFEYIEEGNVDGNVDFFSIT